MNYEFSVVFWRMIKSVGMWVGWERAFWGNIEKNKRFLQERKFAFLTFYLIKAIGAFEEIKYFEIFGIVF